MVGYLVCRRALKSGGDLADHGWLDSAEQVFNLTYENLEATEEDLRVQARGNTRYRRRGGRTPGARFPVIVDSRGHIPRPAGREAGPGVLAGEGVSAGLASGPAKVLHHVGEKPVLPGDILVARATDPGWTPLHTGAMSAFRR